MNFITGSMDRARTVAHGRIDMATTTSRSARLAKWLSIPVGLVISALLIWQASNAAFEGTTASRNNYLETGTVQFDNDTEATLFTEDNLAPGEKDESAPVRVEYVGSLPAEVEFLAENFEDSDHELSKYITLTVEVVESSYNWSGNIYQGTLHSLFEGHNDLGDMTAQVQPGDSATLKFHYAVSPDAQDDVQGKRVEVDFVAKARSLPQNG